MATKEKWAALFEQVIGRKPTGEEFLAGRDTDFDLKQIRAIAGLERGNEVPNNLDSRLSVVQEEFQSTLVQQQVQVPYQAEISPTYSQPQMPYQQMQVPQPAQVKPALTKKQKVTRCLLGLAALTLLGLGGGYYYMDQQTGPDVAVEAFTKALETNNYDEIARLLSTKDSKWTKEEAKGFVGYFTDNEVDLKDTLENLADENGKTVYHDDNGNKLLGLKVVSKKFGIFPEYQVETFPVDLSIKSNLTDLTVDGQKIEKDKEVKLGQIKFVPKVMSVTAKTDLGDLKTNVTLDLGAIENNQAKVIMETNKKAISVTLPDDLPDYDKPRLIVNGKEVAKSLSQEIDLLDNQDLEVYAIFSYEGNDYTTDKVSVNAGSESDLEVELNLSGDMEKRISEAKKAKEAKDEASKKAAEVEKEKERAKEANQTAIYNFLTAYRSDMHDSISDRTNNFSSYFDTNSAIYRTMLDYAVNGGANRAKVDYLTSGEFSITSFQQNNDNTYVMTVHNTFTQHFFNGSTSFVDKLQTFYLRKEGDSYKIYDIKDQFLN